MKKLFVIIATMLLLSACVGSAPLAPPTAEPVGPPVLVETPNANFNFENTVRILYETLNRSTIEAEDAAHVLRLSGVYGVVNAELLYDSEDRSPRMRIESEDGRFYYLRMDFHYAAGFVDGRFYFVEAILDMETTP
ncbi:MAG: hypothetical protein FWE19_05750 [Oscillospiraceae bacterium]|nr:hypothetical protein [Oscillospiraceae bacterium]